MKMVSLLPADSAEACFAPLGGPWLDSPSELLLWTFGPLPDKPSESDADAAELAAASSCGSMQPRYAAGIHTALFPSAAAAPPADSAAPLVEDSVIDGDGVVDDAMGAARWGIGDPLDQSRDTADNLCEPMYPPTGRYTGSHSPQRESGVGRI